MMNSASMMPNSSPSGGAISMFCSARNRILRLIAGFFVNRGKAPVP